MCDGWEVNPSGLAAAVAGALALKGSRSRWSPSGSGGWGALTSWTKGGADYEVVAQCGGFANTSGSTWPVANYVGVTAIFNGTTHLCWFEPIDPVSVAPGDGVTFPSGITFGLRDAYV
jgi:hypothetical protein